MKALLLLLAGVTYLAAGEELSMAESRILRLMKAYDIDPTGLELEEHKQYVWMRREGTLVGYYTLDLVWERRQWDPVDLDGVTSIKFGYDPSVTDSITWFTVDDPEEIAVWAAEYAKRMEFARYFHCFVPLTDKAGFPARREEHESHGVCMCSLGLRFYHGEDLILTLKGHLDDRPEIDDGMRNEAIHFLVAVRMKEVIRAQRRREVGEEDLDPFATDADTTGGHNKVEQGGARQPATRPEPKSK
jgi:hypothetical protein